MPERVIVFIDGSNFYHGMKRNLRRTDVDIHKLCRKLAGKRELKQIMFYGAPLIQQDDPDAYRAQQRFFNRIRSIPNLTLKFGRLEKRRKENVSYIVEKRVDVLVAVDLLETAFEKEYDTAILVSGDGDQVPAVEAAKKRGVRVENAYFCLGRSDALRRACHRYTLLDSKWLKDCLIK